MAAALPRPDAKVIQELSASAPTLAKPALMPCIIGPCYQVVSPTLPAGTLDASALIITAAAIRGLALGESISLSGKKIKVSIDGAPGQIVNFPVTVNSAPISQILTVNILNKQLANVTAQIVDDRLILKTIAKGSSARIKLETIVDDAYEELGLDDFVGVEYKGSSSYTGLANEFYFEDLPSSKAPVKKLVFDEDNLDAYIYGSNTLRRISKDSALNWNASAFGSSKVANVAISRKTQPAFEGMSSGLYGRPIPGSKTNLLLSTGTAASARLPLACYPDAANVTVPQWPDVTNSNYLIVEALGFQNWKDDPNAPIGNFVGVAGNAVTVVFAEDDTIATAIAASWNGAGKVLTIKVKDLKADDALYDAAERPTFARLAEALKVVALLDYTKDLKFTLNYNSALADKAFLTSALAGPYYLGGGTDPHNFSVNGEAGVSVGAAVTGAVKYEDATAAIDIGIDGELLYVSVDGGAWIPITLAGNIQTAIDLALVGVASTSIVALTDSLNTSVNVLRISVTATNNSDSSIAIRADNPKVIEQMFSGFKTRKQSMPDFSALVYSGRKASLLQSAYNPRATGAMEKAVAPGSLKLELSDITSLGCIISDAENADFAAVVFDAPTALSITHSTGGNAVVVIDTLAADTVQGFITKLLVGIAASALDGLVYAAVMNGKVCIFEASGVEGRTVKLVTADTTANVKTILGADLFDVVATTAIVGLVLKDSGSNNALQIISISNHLANHVLHTGFSTTSASNLTAHFLDVGTGTDAEHSQIVHSDGTIQMVFMGESATNQADVTIRKSVHLFKATSDCDITFSRVWACATRASLPDYTTSAFKGQPYRVAVGDLVKSGNNTLGRVVDMQSFKVGASTYTAAQLVLSEYSVANKATLSSWVIYAEGLDSDVTRNDPEMIVDIASNRVTIKAGINADLAGNALTSSAPMYVGYKALRLDVCDEVLEFADIAEVEDSIGPVNLDNPLAFAIYCAFLNSPTHTVSGIGVNAVTDDAPEGTLEAYANALTAVGRKEVHALSLCTQNMEVTKLVNLHVLAYSEPEGKKERIAFCSVKLPTEKMPTPVLTGVMQITDIGGGKFELTFANDSLNVITALDGLKTADGTVINSSAGLDLAPEYGVFLDRSGDSFKWLVTKIVSASTLQIETGDIFMPGSGPASAGNDDAYYQTDPGKLDNFEVDGELCSIFVRQAALDLNTSSGKVGICETLAEIAGGVSGFQNRRLFLVCPESVVTEVGGTDAIVPGYYLTAAIAGMCGQQPARQPFTNFPIVGFKAPVGSSDKFEERTQMAVAANGGIYWVIQDAEGAPLICRHQLSTDRTSVKTQELSITRALDLFAKAVRTTIRNKVGRNNIDKQLIDNLAIALSALGSAYSGKGKELASVSVTTLKVNPSRLDGIVAVFGVVPWFPCNEIEITIVA